MTFISVNYNLKFMTTLADLLGRVEKVVDRNNFIIRTNNLDRSVLCRCSYFCPVEVSDTFYGHGTCIDLKTVTLTQPPLVLPSTDKDTICHLLLRNKVSRKNIVDFYNILAARSTNVPVTLDRMAVDYHKCKKISKSYIPFVTDAQLEKILKWWYHHRVLRQLYLFGLTNTEIRNSWMSEVDLYNQILDNPFMVPSISMEKCLEIKLRSNSQPNPSDLIGGQTLRQLVDKLQSGDMYVPMSLFPDLVKYQDLILGTYPIKQVGDDLVLNHPWTVETKVIDWLKIHVPIKHPEIAQLYVKSHNLTNDQLTAVESALTRDISLITGTAGTGKTTVIGQIVHHLQHSGIKYWAVSFTGKAVSRLKSVVPEDRCRTIHRLLQMRVSAFQYLIIDEISMVTTEMIYQLLTAWDWNFRLILVGDIHQLPPIGWGSFLTQLLMIPNFPIYRLTHHHRFTELDKNGVALNSQLIVNWPIEYPFQFQLMPNFTVFPGGIEIIKQIIDGFYQAKVNINDFRILTPYNQEIDEINTQIQNVYFPTAPGIVDYTGRTWKLGMPVLMTDNNYDVNIMNGEEGEIVELCADHVKIKFGSNIHSFLLNRPLDKKEESEREELHLGMCLPAPSMTCHRSQGSEWKYVVAYFPKNSANFKFLTRNLIYTIITRGKNAVWIVGDIEEVQRGVNRFPSLGREKLAERF